MILNNSIFQNYNYYTLGFIKKSGSYGLAYGFLEGGKEIDVLSSSSVKMPNNYKNIDHPFCICSSVKDIKETFNHYDSLTDDSVVEILASMDKETFHVTVSTTLGKFYATY